MYLCGAAHWEGHTAREDRGEEEKRSFRQGEVKHICGWAIPAVKQEVYHGCFASAALMREEMKDAVFTPPLCILLGV